MFWHVVRPQQILVSINSEKFEITSCSNRESVQLLWATSYKLYIQIDRDTYMYIRYIHTLEKSLTSATFIQFYSFHDRG
jgi:hypothetical protein